MGALGAEELSALGGQAVDTYNQMIEKGFQQNESLSMMQDFLRNARQRYEELGVPIDENTQRLLEMAEAAGIDTEPVETMTSQMTALKDGLGEVVGTLKEGLGTLIELLGGDLPDKWKESVDAAREARARTTPELQKIEEAAGEVGDGIGDVTTKAEDLGATFAEADYSSALDDGRDAADRFREALEDVNRTISGMSSPDFSLPTSSSDVGAAGSPFAQARDRVIAARIPSAVRIPVFIGRRQIAEAVYEDLPALLQGRGALV
jgi:polyhydroxyalkanoate synthesis regulator phasin